MAIDDVTTAQAKSSGEQFVSGRVNGVPPSGIRKFFDIVATMKDVISLGIGEPDFVSPEPILQAGINSLNSWTHRLHLQLRHPGACASPYRTT